MTEKPRRTRAPEQDTLWKDMPWSVPVIVAQIPEAGSHVAFAANADQRAALAQLGGLREISEASAEFDLAHGRGGLIHVTGQVRGKVGQTCVVTLEPMESLVVEPVDITFAPAGMVATQAVPHTAGEEEDIPEPPEEIVGGAINLGRLATEMLFLGIDPYPRKADAVFDAPQEEADPDEHPFAALKALKEAAPPSGKKPKRH
ncbi:MAG: DUF177 domain-containing protein [Afipia sp.]|nr:DUF177 domain-containing protein [Afipia sp.]OJW61949.1 MAG: hypothetical protein BGO65_02050 [Afipia sp. 64-13]